VAENNDTKLTLSRGDFLKTAGAGAVVVAFAVPTLADVAHAAGDGLAAGPTFPALSPGQLDSWLVVGQNGKITVLTGKNDNGQGLDTAFAQIVAEELDVDFTSVRVLMSDTAKVLDQGGASNASGIWQGAVPLRNASAEARRVLLDLASKQLGVPVSGLSVAKGVVTATADASKKATYAELIGGKRFNVALKSNNALGNGLNAEGVAKPKNPKDYTLVGTAVKRDDVRRKALGSFVFTGDVSVAGMLHARVVRPPHAGAKVLSVNGFAKKPKGLVRVVVKGVDFVAVVCEREEQAIKAAKELRVKWSTPTQPFSTMAGLYDHIRNTKPRYDRVVTNVGNITTALAGASKVLEAEYEWPFNSHASMAPGVALADYRADGTITVWSGTQKAHRLQVGIADLLGMPEDKVRCIWVQGPGSYGRNDADDVGLEAALLSKEIGRPVRLQWMRHEGTAWDPKGPAAVIKLRGGLDAKGEMIGYDFDWKGFSGQEVGTSGDAAGETLIGMSLGATRPERNAAGAPAESYGFKHKRVRNQVIPGFITQSNPLRSSHIRDPQGPQTTFAAESFMDELAAAAGADPVEFRLRYVTDPRDRQVIEAAAAKFGWDKRPSPRKAAVKNGVATGRGIAYAQRGPTKVASIVEVEVTLKTGKVWIKRVVFAIDAGLIINPDGVRNTVEGNVIQSSSRALKEEVRFNRNSVLSVDWETYPILNMSEIPQSIETVFVNHKGEYPAAGTGEAPTKPNAGAIANAIFDATGARVRRAPFTPARVKAALDAL
jgi:nicotinate dehydrogenase subunit B